MQSLTLTITEQHAQALGICRQLLDIGSFNLPGKDMEVVVQAKALLTEVIKQCDSVSEAQVEPVVEQVASA